MVGRPYCLYPRTSSTFGRRKKQFPECVQSHAGYSDAAVSTLRYGDWGNNIAFKIAAKPLQIRNMVPTDSQ